MRAQLLADGFTDDQLHRLRRIGVLTPVRRGSYVPSTDPRLRQPVDRHALLVRATLPRLTTPAVVSHVSAAVVHGLAVWDVPLRKVHVTRDAQGGGRVSGRLHLHAAPLDPDEVVDVGGLAVTSPARTVVDLARSEPFEQAVVVADAALAAGLLPDILAGAVSRVSRWPGAPSARHVQRFADGRSESVGESRSRVAFRRAGLPSPVPQWEVRTSDGRLRRVDFAWPGLRTLGEFDGRTKYGRLGRDAADVVYAEKLREDALRALGLTVVRWTWADLEHFEAVAARLRRGFASG